jgi:CRISPR-associated protein Csm2
MEKPTEKDITKIIGGDTRLLVEKAESFAKAIHKHVSTSQIRNAFCNMKKMQMQTWDKTVYAQLLLMKPRLAYMAGRNRKNYQLKDLKEVLTNAIDCVNDKEEESFKNFCNFFEAILAYHKAHGGKS